MGDTTFYEVYFRDRNEKLEVEAMKMKIDRGLLRFECKNGADVFFPLDNIFLVRVVPVV